MCLDFHGREVKPPYDDTGINSDRTLHAIH